MKQIIINYLSIFAVPLIIGILVRILLKHFNKAYFVTSIFAIFALISWIIFFTVPSHGSESSGLLAVQATITFVASLLTGLIFRLKLKKSSDAH